MRVLMIALLAIGLAAGAALAQDAPAQPAPAPARAQKIGYVDTTRVLGQMLKRQDLEAELKVLRGNLDQQHRANVEEVRRLEKEAEQLAMGTPERQALVEKMRTAQTAASQFADKAMRQLEERTASEFVGLHNDIAAEAQRLGKEQDYDLILKDQSPLLGRLNPTEVTLQMAQRVVLYAKPEYDLTDSIAKRLNEKYKETKAKPEEKKPADGPAK